ncbi:MAG TPA: hypothetical protein VGM37_11020 [Armatimonadota bacterium]|jgi:hypothetical protein
MKWNRVLCAVALAVCCGGPCGAQALGYADAITRQVLVINSTPVDYPDAITRQVIVYQPPYATVDLRNALNIAAGLQVAAQADVGRLNIIRDGGSAARVDTQDAARIVRMAMGLDP